MRLAAGAAASLFAKSSSKVASASAKRGKSAAPAPASSASDIDTEDDPDDLAPPVPGHEYKGPALSFPIREVPSPTQEKGPEYRPSWEYAYADPRAIGSARLVGALEKDVPANQGVVAVGHHARKASKADAQWSAMMFDS